MDINNRSSWMGFVIALTALGSLASAGQATEVPGASSGLEARLANLNTALLQRASTLATENSVPRPGPDVVAGFANRSGGGGFANRGGGGGFANRSGGGGSFNNVRGGGGFVNVNPWRNGWADGGGFVNRW